MANAKVFYDNKIIDAAITVTSEATQFEKEKLFDADTASAWRSTGIALQEILFNFGSAINIKGIVIIGSNMDTDVTTFQWQAGTTSATTDENTILPNKKNLISENDWIYQYFKLRLQKSAGTYIEIKEIYLYSETYLFERNYNVNQNKGFETVWVDVNNRHSGLVRSERRYRKFIQNLQFTQVNSVQSAKFQDLNLEKNVIYVPDSSDLDTFYFGVLRFDVPIEPTCGENYTGQFRQSGDLLSI